MVIDCPICSSKARIIFCGYPGYQEPTEFDIAKCTNCETSFIVADEINTTSIYEAIYKNSAQIPGYDRYVEFARNILKARDPLAYLAEQQETYWGIREQLRHGVDKDAMILEVGSGLGYLTYALVKSGFCATGIEISERAVQEATLRYGSFYMTCDLIEYSKISKLKYDILIMTEVIEHLKDIVPFLEAGLKLLRPGGMLIVTTPNRSAYTPDTIWAVDGPPVHLWWLSQKSFVAIAERLACSLSFVDLGGFSASGRWRLKKAKGVTKRPLLDSSGELVPHLRRAQLMKRVRSPLRALNKIRRLVRDKARPVTRSATGPSPTICAILRKSPRTGG